MAVFIDSLPALALLAAAIGIWRAAHDRRGGIRVNLRFAALMLATFAVASLAPEPALSLAAGWLALALGSSALAIGCCPAPVPAWLASLALALAFGAGVAATLVTPMAGFLFQAAVAAGFLAAGIMVRGKSSLIFSISAALSLLSAGLVLLDGRPGRASLFLAAALVLVVRRLENAIKRRRTPRDLLVGASGAG